MSSTLEKETSVRSGRDQLSALRVMSEEARGGVGEAPAGEESRAGEGQAEGLRDEALKAALTGTWELVSYQVELKETGEFIDAMGDSPRGRVIFTPDNWVAFNLEGTGRQPAATESDRAALMKRLVAYIGRYRIEGNQWITSVETAWAPEWVGSEQRRTVTTDGEYANVLTPWRHMPNWGDGKLSRSIIRFRRAR